MKTYLQLVRDFVSEVGVAGGTGPASISISSAGTDRVVQYVRDAHQYVCDIWPDWRFLWHEQEGQVDQSMVDNGEVMLPLPNGLRVRQYVPDSLTINDGSGWRRVPEVGWIEFRRRARLGDPGDPGNPIFYTVRPDGQIELSGPAKDPYDFRIEFYRWADPLTVDEDEIVPPFPRIVLARAKMIYAERENAPEIMHGSAAEYSDLLQRMEANWLEGNAGGRGTQQLQVDLST